MAIGAVGAAGIIGGVAKGIGAVGDARAGKEMGKAAGEQEKRDREAVDESVRRQQLADKQTQARGRATAAASGAVGGTTANYLDVQNREQTRQLDWMRKAGYQDAAERKRAGQQEGSGTRRRGIAGGIGALGGLFG